MFTVIYLTNDQIEELEKISNLISSNDEESIILGCSLFLENYPPEMIDTEWIQHLSFIMRKHTLRECIPNLINLDMINIYSLLNLLENVIKQRYYLVVKEIYIDA